MGLAHPAEEPHWPLSLVRLFGWCPANRHEPGCTCALHRAPVGQGPPGPGWLAISFGFWSGRALATGTAWAGLCLIHYHQHEPGCEPCAFPHSNGLSTARSEEWPAWVSTSRCWRALANGTAWASFVAFFRPSRGGACPPSGARSRRRPLECAIHHHHSFVCVFFLCFWPDNRPTRAGAVLRAAPSERGGR